MKIKYFAWIRELTKNNEEYLDSNEIQNLVELKKQYKKFKPSYLIIGNNHSYNKFIRENKSKVKVYNNYNFLNKILKKKIDYTISAISGFGGLDPTLKIIPHTKTLAIANKESIICGWNIIKKNAKEYKTSIIPVDSEHYSISQLLKKYELKNVNKIYILYRNKVI